MLGLAWLESTQGGTQGTQTNEQLRQSIMCSIRENVPNKSDPTLCVS
jgi:hypothetical protein